MYIYMIIYVYVYIYMYVYMYMYTYSMSRCPKQISHSSRYCAVAMFPGVSLRSQVYNGSRSQEQMIVKELISHGPG